MTVSLLKENEQQVGRYRRIRNNYRVSRKEKKIAEMVEDNTVTVRRNRETHGF